jgi:hypothetical protein
MRGLLAVACWLLLLLSGFESGSVARHAASPARYGCRGRPGVEGLHGALLMVNKPASCQYQAVRSCMAEQHLGVQSLHRQAASWCLVSGCMQEAFDVVLSWLRFVRLGMDSSPAMLNVARGARAAHVQVLLCPRLCIAQVGMDISPAMLDVAVEREVEGALLPHPCIVANVRCRLAPLCVAKRHKCLTTTDGCAHTSTAACQLRVSCLQAWAATRGMLTPCAVLALVQI